MDDRQIRDEAALNDLVYVNKCLRDHLTKDYLAVGYVQGGVLAIKARGEDAGAVWFCPYDDVRDGDDWSSVQERIEALLLPCGESFGSAFSSGPIAALPRVLSSRCARRRSLCAG